MLTDLDILTHVSLFRDLTPGDLAVVVPRFREDTFAQDDYIFFEGDPARHLWVVTDGQVKILKHGDGGKETVIEVIPSGEIFGGAALLLPNHPGTAQAISSLTTLSLSLDEYKALLHEYPAIALRVIEALGQRLLGVVETRVMVGERVERRIAHILLKLASKCGQQTEEGWQLTISLSRQDIADLSDTTVETAIRVMSKFRKEGLVKTLRGGYVVILDHETLRHVSGESQPQA